MNEKTRKIVPMLVLLTVAINFVSISLQIILFTGSTNADSTEQGIKKIEGRDSPQIELVTDKEETRPEKIVKVKPIELISSSMPHSSRISAKLSLEFVEDIKCPYYIFSFLEKPSSEYKYEANNWWRKETPCPDGASYKYSNSVRKCVDSNNREIGIRTLYDVNGYLKEVTIIEDSSFKILSFWNNGLVKQYMYVPESGLGIYVEGWSTGRVRQYGQMEGWGERRGLWVYCDESGSIKEVNLYDVKHVR